MEGEIENVCLFVVFFLFQIKH